MLVKIFQPLLLTALLTACSQAPATRDADVIVVGAGIAGLSAALEASAQGARVLILDANSVGGGHAVKAGGFALVDTALQRSKGIADSPAQAYADWVVRGEDPDPYWAYRYANESAAEVYDWLTGIGVDFRMVLPTSEDSVPRFHFTRATAVNAVVPLMRKLLYDTRIEFAWNTRVVALARSRGRINGVLTRNERDGTEQLYRADAVILSTGGMQNNLQQVRAHWPASKPLPPRLLKGAGHFATGDGYRLAKWAGADLVNMDHQVTFYTGVPDPRDGLGERGLVAQNPAAIWVNAAGHRFMDESADAKTLEANLNAMPTPEYWMLFDAQGARRFSMRDAPWLNSETVRNEVLNNPAIVQQADSLDELAKLTGLPSYGLQTTVETWNRMVQVGEDFKFQRFTRQGKARRSVGAIRTAPFYAVRMHALTRKNMGGPRISPSGQVLDINGQPIAGLYAAGELTGVAGINGSHGGAGTFLGPSVFTGRIAGRSAAAATNTALAYSNRRVVADTTRPSPGAPGYWHFDQVHALVSERGQACTTCHSDTNPMRAANERAILLARLDTCTQCH